MSGARGNWPAARGPFSSPRAGHARRSWPTCPPTFVRLARFSSRGCPLEMRACARVRVLYDKLSCTRLQNYTIGTSLKSVSVSVPWNFSLCMLQTQLTQPRDRRSTRPVPAASTAWIARTFSEHGQHAVHRTQHTQSTANVNVKCRPL